MIRKCLNELINYTLQHRYLLIYYIHIKLNVIDIYIIIYSNLRKTILILLEI